MQKVLILANCQGAALAKILNKTVTPDGEKVFEVFDLKPVYELSAEDQPRLEKYCKSCDILLYQPHTKYKFTPDWRTSDYWVSITSAKYVISFPSLYFSGYNPELTYLRDDKNQHLNAGFVDYHDKRIVKLFLDGLPVEDIAQRFSAIQPVQEDVENLFSGSLSELEKREQELFLTIRVSSFIRDNFTKTRLFYTYNHPANAVLYEVVRQFLGALGREDLGVPVISEELLRYDVFPISPAVKKYLQLAFDCDKNYYRIQNVDLTLSEVIVRYIDIYNAHADWVKAAASFVDETWLNRKKLILHIGQSKTGTTSFQSVCFKNRNHLLENGVLYPATGLVFTHHRKIAQYYKGEESDQNIIAALISEINESACRSVLISCESFEDFNERQIKNLLTDFANFDIYVVCMLRNRVDWVQSMYAEYVKKAWFTGTFKQFLNYRDTPGLFGRLLNWQYRLSIRENQIVRHVHHLLCDKDTLSNWLNVLPVEKVVVADVGSTGLWEVLARVCGIDISALPKNSQPELNIRPSVNAVEIARLYFKQRGIVNLNYPVATQFATKLQGLLSSSNSAESFFSSREQVAEFLSRYGPHNLWLLETFNVDRSQAGKNELLNSANSSVIDLYFYKNQAIIDSVFKTVVASFTKDSSSSVKGSDLWG